MCRHRRHHRPDLLFRVEALDGVESFQSVTTTDDIEHGIEDGDAELETTSVHVRDLSPLIRSKVILLDADRPCNQGVSSLTYYINIHVFQEAGLKFQSLRTL